MNMTKEHICVQTGIACGYPCFGGCPLYEDAKIQQDKIYAEIAKAEKEEHEANMKLLEENGIPAEDFKNLLDYCNLTGKIEVVQKPKGDNQNEKFGIFKQVFVDQWSVGMEGDSFAGFIYGKFDKSKWLKIPYEC